MRILVCEEYGYAYYLWTVDTSFAAVKQWFDSHPLWCATHPTGVMTEIATALEAEHSFEKIESSAFHTVVESKNYDAFVHHNSEFDSAFQTDCYRK